MTQLARHHDGQTLTRLDDLAQREAVSANFLVQILNDLRRGGLIISKRGKDGGYLLSRHPSEITLLEIVHSTEPALLEKNNIQPGESGPRVQQTWEDVSQVLEAKLKSITLESLTTQTPMFYI